MWGWPDLAFSLVWWASLWFLMEADLALGLSSLWQPGKGAQVILEMSSRWPEVFLHSIYLTFK